MYTKYNEFRLNDIWVIPEYFLDDLKDYSIKRSKTWKTLWDNFEDMIKNHLTIIFEYYYDNLTNYTNEKKFKLDFLGWFADSYPAYINILIGDISEYESAGNLGKSIFKGKTPSNIKTPQNFKKPDYFDEYIFNQFNLSELREQIQNKSEDFNDYKDLTGKFFQVSYGTDKINSECDYLLELIKKNASEIVKKLDANGLKNDILEYQTKKYNVLSSEYDGIAIKIPGTEKTYKVFDKYTGAGTVELDVGAVQPEQPWSDASKDYADNHILGEQMYDNLLIKDLSAQNSSVKEFLEIKDNYNLFFIKMDLSIGGSTHFYNFTTIIKPKILKLAVVDNILSKLDHLGGDSQSGIFGWDKTENKYYLMIKKDNVADPELYLHFELYALGNIKEVSLKQKKEQFLKQWKDQDNGTNSVNKK